MTLQEIDDQLELLRLIELAMSDIEVRSKMVILISDRRKENPPYHSFCEYTNCTERIARMFGAMPFGAAIMTPNEIADERKRLLAIKEQLVNQ